MRYLALLVVALFLQGASASLEGDWEWVDGSVVVINEGPPRVLELVGTSTEMKFYCGRRAVIRVRMVKGGGLVGCVDRGLGFQAEVELPTSRRSVWRVAR